MKLRTRITMALACLVLMAGTLAGQAEPAPYITIHYDRIDPAQMADWEANSKQWVEAFGEAKVGKEFNWQAYQSGFSYAWVGDMPNFAFLDQREAQNEMLAEKVGAEKMAALEAGAAGAVVEHYNEIWKYEPGMSYLPADFSPAGMGAISVAVVDVKSAMGKEYRELVEEAIAALKTIEAPVNFFAYSTPFGKGSYAFVSFGEDRAALHSGPEMGGLLTEAVGAEKAEEMFGRYMNCVAAEEERDWRVRPDLSYAAGGEMMEQEEPTEEPTE